MNIVLVGMAGSGNLGDDLMSTMLAKRLADRFPDSRISVLSGGYPNAFGYPERQVSVLVAGPGTRRGLGRRELRQLFEDAELLVIGGGGLLQDVHQSATTWKWLRYMRWVNRRQCIIWGVALGVGPIRSSLTKRYLRSALPCFDALQVRDRDSYASAVELGGQPSIVPDIVAGSDVGAYGFVRPEVADQVLGCSIRPWPTLSLSTAVSTISATAERAKLEKICLFTFEWYPANETEEAFQAEVAEALTKRGHHCDLLCYGKHPLNDFTRAFSRVSLAIAMRLHANILWLKLGVPVIPVSYAPKVTALYADHSPVQWSHSGGLPVGSIAGAQFQQIYELPSYSKTVERSVPPFFFDYLFQGLRLVSASTRLLRRFRL